MVCAYNGTLLVIKWNEILIHTAMKWNEILIYATIQMNLKHIMLSEIGQLQKGKYYMSPIQGFCRLGKFIETEGRKSYQGLRGNVEWELLLNWRSFYLR